MRPHGRRRSGSEILRAGIWVVVDLEFGLTMGPREAATRQTNKPPIQQIHERDQCTIQRAKCSATAAKMRVIRRFTQTSKLMKQLVSIVYGIVCLALDLERDYNTNNLLKVAEQPLCKFEDVKQLLEQSGSLGR